MFSAVVAKGMTVATFQDMLQTNPDIRNQYDWWRGARSEKGENPIDWDAFRQHIVAIGQPDPGNRPPDDWVGDDYKQANPDWWANYANRTP
jgi:hypothetical protein